MTSREWILREIGRSLRRPARPSPMHRPSCSCHSHGGFLLGRSPEGLAQRDLWVDEVDAMAAKRYVDSMGSVSGLELERDLYEIQSAEQLLEQCERFHNGS